MCSFFTFGALGHIYAPTRFLTVKLTPWVLLLFGGLVLVLGTGLKKKIMLWCAGTYFFAFFMEVAGVHSGLVFGRYYYGTALGPRLLAVPLIIGLNWVLVVMAAADLGRRATGNSFAAALTAGAVTVIFDYPLEIVAVKLDYWQWLDPAVPVQNYLAWFFISMIAALIYNLFVRERPRPVVVHYLFVQFLFFVVLVMFFISRQGLTSSNLALY